MGPEAAVAFKILSTGLSVIGGMKRASAQEDAAERQRAAAEQSQYLAERNAASIEAENAEMARRKADAARAEEAMARVRGLASGQTGRSGSLGAYLDEQVEQNQRDIDWLRRSGKSQSELERQRGRNALMEGMARADTTEAQASNTRWSAIGAGFKSGAGIFGGADYGSVSSAASGGGFQVDPYYDVWD